MKFSSVLFLSFFILLLFANGIGARNSPEDYWKKVMKDQPIPEAINGIIDQKMVNPSEENSFWSHFKRDFDVTSNAIIYHPHQENNHRLPSD
ncbi:organ-specific protein S2-like [Chenopodium quinoa]|uniref:organ-specific protein S2-like n=1 Tax=Chenopodium quinoa TaxID=63459 RepID=UPI000B78811D|nr:organ-specific protein S2-like [Chenopodium quinoa]